MATAAFARSVTVAATLGCFAAACSSSTLIQSNPPGATVYINGSPVGRTPYRLQDRKIMGSTTQIRLEAPGYAPLDTVITRNEELDGLALVAGIFFLVPLLWVMEYQDNHIYALAAGGAPIPGPGDPQAHSAPPLPRPGTEPSPSSATGNDAVRERTRRANELNVEGRELIRSGEYTAAVDKFDAAIKIVPDPRFYFNMCVAYEQMGNASAAITACEGANAHEPSDRLREKIDKMLESLTMVKSLNGK